MLPFLYYTNTQSLMIFTVLAQRCVMVNYLLLKCVCNFFLTGNQSVIFASQGLRFGSPFSPPLADLEYILRIRALISHWLRLPVHLTVNQVKVSKIWQTGKLFSLEPKREVANRCHMRAFRCHLCLHFVDNMCSV
jgi:hypothetical protein